MIKTRWLFSAITAVAVAGCGDKGTGEMQSLCSEDGSTAPVDFRIGSRTELDRVVATVAACPGISFGSLTIADSDDLEHVDGLGQLAYLDGDLIIRNNAALSDLEGLARLEGIRGGLEIRGNATLTDLDGLALLKELGGDLGIRDNAALAELDGLPISPSWAGM